MSEEKLRVACRADMLQPAAGEAHESMAKSSSLMKDKTSGRGQKRLETPDSHVALRATNIDRQIRKLEESVSLKGVKVKGRINELLNAFVEKGGIITNDEEVCLLAKLYLFSGAIFEDKRRVPLIELSIGRFFDLEDLIQSLYVRLMKAPLRFSTEPGIALFDAIAKKRREQFGQKPIFNLLIQWERDTTRTSKDIKELMDMLRTLAVTKEARLLIFSERLSRLPEELLSGLAVINPGGYFS